MTTRTLSLNPVELAAILTSALFLGAWLGLQILVAVQS